MSGSLALLEEEWRKDTAGLPRARANMIYESIFFRHNDPQRRYHGLSHLEALFALLHKHAPHIAAETPPRLAVWWHDAVYDPQARDNEENSADLARVQMAELGIVRPIIEETSRLILMTKNHWDGPSAGDGDCFLDADIAILGASPAAYDAYSKQVREEYSWAPDDRYRAGRSAFLNFVLARSRLFRTDAFETAYAAQARANMGRELSSLA